MITASGTTTTVYTQR